MIPSLASQLASALVEVDGVRAVALGGSWAQGTADEVSDLDLGIYYERSAPPCIAGLRRLAAEWDAAAHVTGLGEWGSHVNGGAWLSIDGQSVDWIYRDLQAVRQAIDDAERGRLSFGNQAGHPYGFASTFYAGELHYAVPLQDPEGALADLKPQAEVLPSALRDAFVHRLWEAGFLLEGAAKSVARGDVAQVSGVAYRAVMSMAQALLAHHGRWVTTEKGAVAAVDALPRRPSGFAREVTDVLGRLGRDPEELRVSVARLQALLGEVRRLCQEPSQEVTP